MRTFRCSNCHIGLLLKDSDNPLKCPECKSESFNIYKNSQPTPKNIEEYNKKQLIEFEGALKKLKEINTEKEVHHMAKKDKKQDAEEKCSEKVEKAEKSEKIEKPSKSEKQPKKTMTGMVKELMATKIPKEISELVSKEFNCNFSEGKVKSTIAYLNKQK
jgi:phage FluMu protein Com